MTGVPRSGARSAHLLLTVLCGCLSILSAYSQQKITLPRLHPSETISKLKAMDEPLSVAELIDASLLLSEVDPEYLPSGHAKLMRYIEELSQSVVSSQDKAALSEKVLLFMHKRILARYSERVTRMDDLLERGTYNCVSSAVLYVILARSVGLEVRGVKTKDHAFCLVRFGNTEYDVETTNVYGFNPGEKKEFLDQFGRTTGFTYVPPSNYSGRSEIGELALLALIPANKSSLLNDRRRFAEAVGPAVDAYVLSDDADLYEKMVSVMVNLASWYNVKEQFAEGISYIDTVMALYGKDPRLVKSRADLLHNWIVYLIEEGDFAGAKALIDQRYASGELGRSQWLDFRVYICQLEAQTMSRSGSSLRALEHIEKAIEELGEDKRLLKSRGVYRRNIEARAHNAMVAAYNTKQYERAKRIIEEALEILPDSRQLRVDLELVVKALTNR
jgi:hypothetical protein